MIHRPVTSSLTLKMWNAMPERFALLPVPQTAGYLLCKGIHELTG